VSCTSFSPQHYETAARVTCELVERLAREPLPGDTILNVNVPDVPTEALRGLRVTRLGNRHRAERAQPACDPRGRPIWWIGGAGPEQDCGEGTDFHAVAAGYASVTPLLVDLTRHEALPRLRRWVESA
jgi:5''-nucleotidase (EC 3.1.3.5)/3''-nucleotidase (EC 3.1.3.6)/exopolyphosphatase (EC 3.6.1.11)